MNNANNDFGGLFCFLDVFVDVVDVDSSGGGRRCGDGMEVFPPFCFYHLLSGSVSFLSCSACSFFS